MWNQYRSYYVMRADASEKASAEGSSSFSAAEDGARID